MARYSLAMLTPTSLPLIFTDADVQSVARAHANNTGEVKFGGASVVFRSVDDLHRSNGSL